MKTKKRMLVINMIIFMFMGVTLKGQELGATGLFQHGYNSSGVLTASEDIDSVTVTGTLNFYVQPDPLISPLYNFVTSPTNNLNSTFTWTATPAAGVTINDAVAGYATNWAAITWPGVATAAISLNVKETSNTGSCTDITGTTITVQVINEPNVTNVTFAGVPCPTGTPPYNVPGPLTTLTITSDIAGAREVQVIYNLNGPAGFTNLTNQVANVGDGNTIDLSGVTLTQPGTYTFEVVSITDRISQKSGVINTLNANYTFVLNRVPVTGPIYHKPNM